MRASRNVSSSQLTYRKGWPRSSRVFQISVDLPACRGPTTKQTRWDAVSRVWRATYPAGTKRFAAGLDLSVSHGLSASKT